LGAVRVELPGARAAAAIGNEWRAHPNRAAIAVRPTEKFGATKGWAYWVAGLILVLAVFSAVHERALGLPRDAHHTDIKRNLPPPGIHAPSTHAPSTLNNRFEVRRYVMDFAGDHSLDVATVIEQGSAGSTRYTVQLHLASGVEQSVVVAAPPGGLLLEMRDMTGDKVPNDLILRPTLIRRLPTVLVNDGHNHFAVAISGTNSNSFSSNTDLGSPSREVQNFALLSSSGFKAIALPIRHASFEIQYPHGLASSLSLSFQKRFSFASSSGRAPPHVIAV